VSACQFDFSLPAEVSSLLEGLRADFARFGGTVSGDGGPGFGEFSLPTPLGTFSGTYEVSSDTPGVCAVHIEVDEKPMFVPCSPIQDHPGPRLSKSPAR